MLIITLLSHWKGDNMIERRKDSKGRVLKDGEHERANGTYEYKWRDKIGKRHSVYAKTLDDLRDKENDILRETIEGITQKPCNLTINDLFNLWKDVKRGLKGNTLGNYTYIYELFVLPDFGKMKIVDVKRTDVRRFYNRLHEVRGLKVSTVDSVHTVLHQVIELAVENEYIRYNPSDNALKELKRANNDSEKRKALTLNQQNLFEDFLRKEGKHHRWYPIFETFLWSGMRCGELTGLRWCDVDFINNTININHTLAYYSKGRKSGLILEIHTPKTEAGNRIIPMLPRVKEALLMEKKMQEDLGIRCNDVINGYTDFIFVNRFGAVFHQGSLNKVLRRLVRDCNLEIIDANQGIDNLELVPAFSCHIMRHTFTTRMCEANINMKVMQDVLGHADAETTMNIYAEAQKDFKISELEALNEFYS